MNQEKIFSLLTEAASPDCTLERASSIMTELKNVSFALTKHQSREANTPYAGLIFLLERLFEETVEHDKTLLPTLFPVFALLCGEKEGGTLLAPEINWSAMKP